MIRYPSFRYSQRNLPDDPIMYATTSDHNLSLDSDAGTICVRPLLRLHTKAVAWGVEHLVSSEKVKKLNTNSSTLVTALHLLTEVLLVNSTLCTVFLRRSAKTFPRNQISGHLR